MSSAKTIFTVIETVQCTFELTEQVDNVVTVIGTYKSKYYAVRKLKQLSLKVQNPNKTYFFEEIVGSDWVRSEHVISELIKAEEETAKEMLQVSLQLSDLAKDVETDKTKLSVEQLADALDKLRDLMFSFNDLSIEVKQSFNILEHANYAVSVLEPEFNKLIQENQAKADVLQEDLFSRFSELSSKHFESSDINELQEVIRDLENLYDAYSKLPCALGNILIQMRKNILYFENRLFEQMKKIVSAVKSEKQAAGADMLRPAQQNCTSSEVDLLPTSNTGGLDLEKQAGTLKPSETSDDLTEFVKDSDVFEEKKNIFNNLNQNSNVQDVYLENKSETSTFSKISDDLPEFLEDSDVFEEIKNLQVSETYRQILIENGQMKEVMLRRGLNTPAFIDTISFTINEQAFHRFEETVETDFKQHGKVVQKTRRVEGLEALSEGLAEFLKLMGLPVLGEGSGRNGYAKSILLGNQEQQRNYGFIAYGGLSQNGSVMFHLTGEGLAMARNGWELFLYAWLKKHERLAKITRVDIAHDMIFGGYSVNQAVEDWKNDCYTVRQTRPHCEIQGVDWLSGTNKGKTAYIGSKKSSRILYFYEKGKQLGDESSEWVRVELRQRSKDYIIPFDVLIHAGDYLCTAYPYLSKVLDYDFAEQYSFERIKKQNGIAIGHVIKYAKMQVSPAIKMLKSIGLDEQEIVKELFNEKARLPKRLILKEDD